MVIPRESEWFGAFKEGAEAEIVPMEQQPLYKEDWIGLQQLNKTNRLDLLVRSVEGKWAGGLLQAACRPTAEPAAPLPPTARRAPATTCSLRWSGSRPTSSTATLCKLPAFGPSLCVCVCVCVCVCACPTDDLRAAFGSGSRLVKDCRHGCEDGDWWTRQGEAAVRPRLPLLVLLSALGCGQSRPLLDCWTPLPLCCAQCKGMKSRASLN